MTAVDSVYAVVIDPTEPPEFVAEDFDGVYDKTRVGSDPDHASSQQCQWCGGHEFEVRAKMYGDRPPDFPFVQCTECAATYLIQMHDAAKVVF